MNEALRTRIGGLLKEKYADFGAILASEKLLQLDGIKVLVEMVLRMQIGLASGGRRRDERGGCFSCANAGPGSANSSRSTAARTTGLNAARRVAR
jgi:hypothetical protein